MSKVKQAKKYKGDQDISRRNFLEKGLTGLSVVTLRSVAPLTLGTLIGCNSSNQNTSTNETPQNNSNNRNTTVVPSCVLMAEQEEGPYYLDLGLIRSNITDGKPGVPLNLKFLVIDTTTCQPLPNAAVDIWHCDATGVYSGFAAEETSDESFLRGVQITGADGTAQFATIFPGWYQGRTTHIHMKVRIAGNIEGTTYTGGNVSHTGQLFFDPKDRAAVTPLSPYSSNPVVQLANTEDNIYNTEQGSSVVIKLDPIDSSSISIGYSGTLVLGVNPKATPEPIGPVGPAPGAPGGPETPGGPGGSGGSGGSNNP